MLKTWNSFLFHFKNNMKIVALGYLLSALETVIGGAGEDWIYFFRYILLTQPLPFWQWQSIGNHLQKLLPFFAREVQSQNVAVCPDKAKLGSGYVVIQKQVGFIQHAQLCLPGTCKSKSGKTIKQKLTKFYTSESKSINKHFNNIWLAVHVAYAFEYTFWASAVCGVAGNFPLRTLSPMSHCLRSFKVLSFCFLPNG